MNRRALAVLAALLLAACGSSKSAERKSPVSPLEELGWLAGTWSELKSNTLFEETWTAPVGAGMVGMSRVVTGASPRAYELMSLQREGSDTLLRIRHFDAALVPAPAEAEGALVYRLVGSKDGEATFDNVGTDKARRIVYAREKDTLTVTLLGEGGALVARHVFGR